MAAGTQTTQRFPCLGCLSTGLSPAQHTRLSSVSPHPEIPISGHSLHEWGVCSLQANHPAPSLFQALPLMACVSAGLRCTETRLRKHVQSLYFQPTVLFPVSSYGSSFFCADGCPHVHLCFLAMICFLYTNEVMQMQIHACHRRTWAWSAPA